jgi:hypothetical protein
MESDFFFRAWASRIGVGFFLLTQGLKRIIFTESANGQEVGRSYLVLLSWLLRGN